MNDEAIARVGPQRHKEKKSVLRYRQKGNANGLQEYGVFLLAWTPLGRLQVVLPPE